ncbi:peptidoglycan bridge formation glycyltransferase FemA/FemB family protein [Oceanobacillus sp. HCA-5259]|uniref:peptidoglycan bridge formation glycyltransferase FemA/FemB family protein n=1 Tax=Oceanobacillus sp. HCA-5259 TaxID=3134661 RepID=UPI0030BBB9BC
MLDIYFDENYGRLYEKIEKGQCHYFNYESDYGKVYHMFIKREIPIKINDTVYYDLVTPYGYGGPLIIEFIEGQKDTLLKEFEEEFSKYCENNNIVSEFVRFHPIFNNSDEFKSVYNVNYIRDTVGTDLLTYDDPFQSEFSKSCRKNVRKALKNGVHFKVTENPSDISSFKKIYYSTMDRNNASDYYYFDDDYFNKCLELFPENLLTVEAIYNDTTIAMGFYFIYDKIIHIHLSGTLSEYLYLSPAYILRYAVTLWGKENGYEMIHHGGGRTNASDDGLYLFKKQFGKNTNFEFKIGKKIWNSEVYNSLCEVTNVEKNTNFFPAYRQV